MPCRASLTISCSEIVLTICISKTFNNYYVKGSYIVEALLPVNHEYLLMICSTKLMNIWGLIRKNAAICNFCLAIITSV